MHICIYLIVPTSGLRIVTRRDNNTEHSIKVESGRDVVRWFAKNLWDADLWEEYESKDIESFENGGATTVPIVPP
jgi:hypothetical protein